MRGNKIIKTKPMSSDNSSKLSSFDQSMDSFPNIFGFLDVEKRFNRNFSSDEDQTQEEINFLNDDFGTFSSANFSLDPLLPFGENKVDTVTNKLKKFFNLFNEESQKDSTKSEKYGKIFVISKDKKKESLFIKTDTKSSFSKEDEKLIGKKRLEIRRPRRENKDNMRKKIKRSFLNYALIKKLNDKLKSKGYAKYFEKFPSFFVTDIDRKRNKDILNMTLKEIFEKKELYKYENQKGFSNSLHNLKVVQSEEISENSDLKNIFNKTFSELYIEYINSDDYKIVEINRLKENKMNDEYIKRYIYLSRNLIEFFRD